MASKIPNLDPRQEAFYENRNELAENNISQQARSEGGDEFNDEDQEL